MIVVEFKTTRRFLVMNVLISGLQLKFKSLSAGLSLMAQYPLQATKEND